MFKYIPRNITYHRAHAKVAFSSISDDNCCSNCFGDCLSSEIRCACADNTGGKFAYLPGGIVKEEFLEDFILMNCSPHQKNLCYCEECPLERSKDSCLSGTCNGNGHLVRKFIKECWYKCGCAQGCGNRIVLRRVHRLQVRPCCFKHLLFWFCKCDMKLVLLLVHFAQFDLIMHFFLIKIVQPMFRFL